MYKLVLLGLLVIGILLNGCSESPTKVGSKDNLIDLGIVTDTSGPYVTFAYPGGIGTHLGCEVEWGTPVVVAFSEPIDPQSVTQDNFNVGDGKEGQLEVCGNTVVFKPTLAFDNLILVGVTVGGSVSDTAGNAMGEDYTFTFCTRGEP